MAKSGIAIACRDFELEILGTASELGNQSPINLRRTCDFPTSFNSRVCLLISDCHEFINHWEELVDPFSSPLRFDNNAFFLGIWFHFFASRLDFEIR